MESNQETVVTALVSVGIVAEVLRQLMPSAPANLNTLVFNAFMAKAEQRSAVSKDPVNDTVQNGNGAIPMEG